MYINMCLYPKLIKNRKYLPNKKNGGVPPTPKDTRVLYVAVGCGNCIECRQQKAREWRIRLLEELRMHKYKYFITLTFSEEALQELAIKGESLENNAVAGKGVRMFLERWRKKYKHSIKHWLITEMGHENTERIHLHGILFVEEPITNEELAKLWKYGRTDTGKYCNERSINYIVKYITKVDGMHKGFKPQIFCSAGLGTNYLNTINAERNKYNGNKTFENYILPNGNKLNLPIYYRNKIYTEEEREQLWLNKIDLGEIYVRGIKCNVNTEKGLQEYNDILKCQQESNIKMGYGDDSKEWKKKDYNITLRKLNAKYKLQKARKECKNIT